MAEPETAFSAKLPSASDTVAHGLEPGEFVELLTAGVSVLRHT